VLKALVRDVCISSTTWSSGFRPEHRKAAKLGDQSGGGSRLGQAMVMKYR
jgi:hypothetical protein